jgi:hypothetical protein
MEEIPHSRRIAAPQYILKIIGKRRVKDKQ